MVSKQKEQELKNLLVAHSPAPPKKAEVVDEAKLESDAGYRFGYVSKFIGLSADDIATVKSTAPILAPLVPGIVDAVYNKLFHFTCTKRHFTLRNDGYSGSVDGDVDHLTLDDPQIKFRKAHLEKYLVRLVSAEYDANMVKYLDRVGKIHTNQTGSKNINVPLVQMNVLMAWVRDAIMAVVVNIGLPHDTEVKVLRAWGKLLSVQSDLIVRHYASKAAAANAKSDCCAAQGSCYFALAATAAIASGVTYWWMTK
eukprot:TRINITY_DN84_c0_g1_i1.p1 TRINITY_DN84_c0_g1~~TRINITY_DN84_c0_g1_i1.p1  ORF type:complete len:254 (-),score=81.21 TRINITY_DN84_c0_g1_i1:66-827(-)